MRNSRIAIVGTGGIGLTAIHSVISKMDSLDTLIVYDEAPKETTTYSNPVFKDVPHLIAYDPPKPKPKHHNKAWNITNKKVKRKQQKKSRKANRK